MASNGVLSPPPAAEALPDNVTLRIVILAHGNRTEDDLYLVLNLDTTVGSLKERIRQSLAQQPSPDTQRLIYHGRPLQENNSTLRQILRLDQSATNAPTAAHVLHLVIRDGQGGLPQQSDPTPQRPQVQTPIAGNVAHGPQVAGAQQALLQTPQILSNFLPQPFAAPLQTAQTMLHNQLHMMQHQMQHQMAVNNAQQAAQRMAATHAPNQVQAPQERPTPQIPGVHERLDSVGRPEAPHQAPAVQSFHAPNTPHDSNPHQRTGTSTHPQGSSVRIQETIGPHGERIRTVINNGNMTFRIGGQGVPNPFERPASAPGLSPTAEQAPPLQIGPTQLPNQIQPAPSVHIHHGPPQIPPPGLMPLGRQFPPPPHMMNFPPTPFPVMPGQMLSQTQPSQTMAWLLNSPNGPQGIVFAPGHGFFSSHQPTEATTSNISDTPRPTPTVPAAADITGPTTRAATGLPPETNQLARLQERVQQRGQRHVANQAQAQRQNVEEYDVLNFMLQRGWLFLRLYMFIFVLSEAGTWRRFIMLGMAVLVCLLPRRNPFTEGFAAARRHFDNLIGPPELARRQAQERRQGQQEQQGVAENAQAQQNQPAATSQTHQATSRPRPSTTAPTVPSPEENARRLLRENRERNPNVMRDMFYRVEQAMALFLASLVPGVGERHVRAREEARRIIDEEERRRQEEQQRTNETQNTTTNAGSDETKNESISGSQESPNTGAPTASSSAVDTSNSADAEGVRLRTGESS